MNIGSANKINLGTDGLVVGDNQLATTGGGVYIKRNLVVDGNIYVTGNIVAAVFEGPATKLIGTADSIKFPLQINLGGTGAVNSTDALKNLNGITASRATALSLILK
jgi:hypothetical protein